MEKLPLHLVPGSWRQWQVPYMTSMVGGQCVNGDDNGAWKKTHQPLIEGLVHNKTSSSLPSMAKMPRFLKGT